ncbi:MAG: rod shape-determining protein RodA [Gammaproteobacteria bacterium]|nr:rod shape-determining protein RodA [Gammaproteobacteria bacterium]
MALNNPQALNQHRRRYPWQWLHLDLTLLAGILLLTIFGLFILYSAGQAHRHIIISQGAHFAVAFVFMILVAQIPPSLLARWAPWCYLFSVLLLLAVLALGHSAKGAERWLSIGGFRFQPAELTKLTIPMMLAWYFNYRPLPPKFTDICVSLAIIVFPALLVAKQPDLGTAIILLLAGAAVLFLAGISWRLITGAIVALVITTPLLWHFMKSYQRQRVLTFLSPERDPLGAGYHIIQSKIAIGSGGLLGKGFLHGTQSHLHFLPESSTDFIFAIAGEEFGLIGCLLLIALYLAITSRGLYIASQGQETFSRLLAGCFSLMFLLSAFINMGMVSGILPVVGVPLPLVSYSGTSMLILLGSFGILMSIHHHKKLF